MFARVNSFGVQGLSGFAVTAEADISGGLPQFSIVGLPDSAVKEAADRVRSAAKNLGFAWPASRITVNLAPARLRIYFKLPNYSGTFFLKVCFIILYRRSLSNAGAKVVL